MIAIKVPAPEIAVPRHGLVDSGNVVTDKPDSTWENGVTFHSDACLTLAGGPAGICLYDDEDPAAREPHECQSWHEFRAFNIEIASDWSTFDGDEVEARLRRALDVGTSGKLERLIWDGHADVTSPKLTDATTIGGGAVTPQQAVGLLENALRDTSLHVGSRGTIHMSALLATMTPDLKVGDDGSLTTLLGSKIVVGDYDSDFMVAHAGAVDVYLGEVDTMEALEEVRRFNRRQIVVQRTALAAWNACASYKVAVNAGLPEES